jgi:hypothetical protein
LLAASKALSEKTMQPEGKKHSEAEFVGMKTAVCCSIGTTDSVAPHIEKSARRHAGRNLSRIISERCHNSDVPL